MTFAFGVVSLMYRAIVAIGERLWETFGLSSGKDLLIYSTKAGQQELVRNPVSASSFDSACATISAPRAASTTVWKPNSFSPVTT